LTYLRLFSEK